MEESMCTLQGGACMLWAVMRGHMCMHMTQCSR